MKTKIDSILFCNVNSDNHYPSKVAEHFGAHCDVVVHSERWIHESFSKYKEHNHSVVIIVDDGNDWLSLAYAKTWFESRGIEWFFLLSELKGLNHYCEDIDFNRCVAVTCPIDDHDSLDNLKRLSIPYCCISNRKEGYEHQLDQKRIESVIISHIEQHLS